VVKCKSKCRIPCDIDGGLSEISFLIDFWHLNTIPLEFWQKKIKMAEIIGWVKNPFSDLKNSKSEIFQKILPRFVVLSSPKLS
jgi:hypothetical protein